jgi:hypothetical protein
VLIQERDDGLRLIRQHEHALLAGALAAKWSTRHGRPLPLRTVLASALHDSVWQEEDEHPRLDPARGRPFDFTTIPLERKRELIDRGVRTLARVDAVVAALVLDHHRALLDGLEVEPTSELAWVRFVDNLSLLACLTPPGSLESSRPRWISPRLTSPDGEALSASWRQGRLVLSPAPFSEPLQHVLPYRDIPRRVFEQEDDLRRAWDDAPEQHWRLEIGP